QVRGVIAGLRAPACLRPDGSVRAVALGEPLAAPPRRLAAPLRPFSAALAEGAFALFDDGMPATASRRLSPQAALAHMAERLWLRSDDVQSVAEDAVAVAVKRYRKRHSDDFFAL